MGAAVEVHNVMMSPGRGLVLLGHVKSGSVAVGQHSTMIAFGETPSRRLEVASVERLSSMENKNPAVGISFNNPPHPEHFKRRFPAGSVLLLEEAGSATEAAQNKKETR